MEQTWSGQGCRRRSYWEDEVTSVTVMTRQSS